MPRSQARESTETVLCAEKHATGQRRGKMILFHLLLIGWIGHFEIVFNQLNGSANKRETDV